MAKTVVALYDTLTEARAAIDDLVASGFDRQNISLVANASDEQVQRNFDERGEYRAADDMDADGNYAGEGAATGAGVGAAIGGVGGLLVGLGLLTIPGVGPALAAGPLASTLVGAGVGGVAGGLLGALVGAGVPEDEANRYAEGVRRGGTLVMVNAADERADEAAAILDRHAAVDVEERSTNWRERGWERHSEEERPLTSDQVREERDHAVIPVVEEDVRVGKREVERGGIRARTYVSEHPVEEQVTLRDERINVHREPADRPATADDFRSREVTMHEPDEEAGADKRARGIEEGVVDKEAVDHTETVRDTARRTEVEVEGEGEDFSRYERTFQGHFRDSDLSGRYDYDDVAPAYRYGWSLANSERFRDREWDEIEPEARRAWEERNRGTWEEFRDPVWSSWREARGRR